MFDIIHYHSNLLLLRRRDDIIREMHAHILVAQEA